MTNLFSISITSENTFETALVYTLIEHGSYMMIKWGNKKTEQLIPILQNPAIPHGLFIFNDVHEPLAVCKPLKPATHYRKKIKIPFR